MDYLISFQRGIKSTASAIYEKASGPYLTTISMLCLREVHKFSRWSGRKISALTCRRVQLNNFVLAVIRARIRTAAVHYVIPPIVLLGTLTASATRLSLDTCKTVLGAPVIEELVFRLPVLIAAQGIDYFSGGSLGQPITEAIDLTGADLLKGMTIVLTSILFTYAHGPNPDADRAAGLFGSGVALSVITLKSGLNVAIVSHIIHNARAIHSLEMGEVIDASIEEPTKE